MSLQRPLPKIGDKVVISNDGFSERDFLHAIDNGDIDIGRVYEVIDIDRAEYQLNVRLKNLGGWWVSKDVCVILPALTKEEQIIAKIALMNKRFNGRKNNEQMR